MAFRNWRIGMHIQQDHIAIVALLHERSRWALRRWWNIRLMPGTVRQGMVVDVESLYGNSASRKPPFVGIGTGRIQEAYLYLY